MIKQLSSGIILFFAFLFINLISAQAQETQPQMADVMRSNGKIYVVVVVLAVIFAGIILYLIRIERKINKLEKREQQHLK